MIIYVMNNITSMQHPKAKPKCYTPVSRKNCPWCKIYFYAN